MYSLTLILKVFSRVMRKRKEKVSKEKEGYGKEMINRFYSTLIYECKIDKGKWLEGLEYIFIILFFINIINIFHKIGKNNI